MRCKDHRLPFQCSATGGPLPNERASRFAADSPTAVQARGDGHETAARLTKGAEGKAAAGSTPTGARAPTGTDSQQEDPERTTRGHTHEGTADPRRAPRANQPIRPPPGKRHSPQSLTSEYKPGPNKRHARSAQSPITESTPHAASDQPKQRQDQSDRRHGYGSTSNLSNADHSDSARWTGSRLPTAQIVRTWAARRNGVHFWRRCVYGLLVDLAGRPCQR